MDSQERREIALDHVLAARKAIDEAEVEPDPVQQRRLDVRAAKHLRDAANQLADFFRLTE